MADSDKPVVVELGIEFVVELLLFLYPFGAEQMNLPHNFWLGLGCWIVGTTIAIRMFWIFPLWAKRLSPPTKSIVAVLCVAGLIWLFYKPVVGAYAKWKAEKPQSEVATNSASPSTSTQTAAAQAMPSSTPAGPATGHKATKHRVKTAKSTPLQQAASREAVQDAPSTPPTVAPSNAPIPNDDRPCAVKDVIITGYGNNGIGIVQLGDQRICNVKLTPGEYTGDANQPNSGVSTPPTGPSDTHGHTVEVNVQSDSGLTQAQANDLVLEAIGQFVKTNNRMPKNDELKQQLRGVWVNIDCEAHGTGILNSGASSFENVTIEQTSCDTGVSNSANGASFKGLHITISNGIVTQTAMQP